jgi:hypothetical protein
MNEALAQLAQLFIDKNITFLKCIKNSFSFYGQ